MTTFRIEKGKSMAAAKKVVKKSAGAQDAVELLTADHREVKAMFAQYEKLAEAGGKSSDREALAETICDMLIVHATIEEEIFYPATRKATEDDDLLDEAQVEHAAAKELIAQIKDLAPDDDLYDAKVKVLGEQIDQHVEEEESEMFPEAKKSDMDLLDLGARLLARKNQLLAEIGESAA
jgi:hemerythrin superfamily protein